METKEELIQAKSFNSISEFKTLQELPETKPLALVASSGIISYSNKSFTLLFGLREGGDLASLESEPDLRFIVSNFTKSQYSSFHFDLFIPGGEDSGPRSYYVDIDRVMIEESEYFVFVFTSHSERKKIEKRINNIHNALEYGGVAVIITDESGKINYSSQASEKMLKLSIEQLYNSYLPDVLEAFIDSNDAEELKLSIYKNTEWKKLISGTDAAGRTWYKELHLKPARKSDAEPPSFILVANDITNYVLKNRIIKKSEQRQRTIKNNISDPLLIVRRENNNLIFESANDNFYAAFDLKREEVINKNLNSAINADLFISVFQAIEVADNKSMSPVEFRYSLIKHEREFLGKLAYFDDVFDGTRIYIINLVDITEQLLAQERLRKAYEKETRVNKLKSAFLANMSHEIRTPLNAIVGYSDLLEDDIQNESYEYLAENTTYLKEGVNRLLKLVDNIVEVSILESGEHKFDIEPRNINVLMEEVGIDMRDFAESKKVHVERDFDDESLYVNVDEMKFRKIIAGLIENAIKYNKPNGIVLLRTEKLQNYVRIEIKDTGIGIDEDKLNQILEPFAQDEEEGYTRKYEGAGLGLTIAFRLTQLLGGKFKVESEIGKGTTISLTFPLLTDLKRYQA